MENYFREQLAKQLGFLQRSCQSYDQGIPEEAVRIATTLRILFHDTKKQTSLLSHLGARDIMLRTSINPPEKRDGYELLWHGSELSGIEMRCDNPADAEPTLLVAPYPFGVESLRDFVVPVDTWWDGQPVYIFLEHGPYTRKDLVLSAADTDGGAHVDRKLPPMYGHISRTLASAAIVGDSPEGRQFRLILSVAGSPPEGGTEIKNLPYADLRQMATELLNSPELLALAGVA